jgi:predicted DCC family thiol-disulfide oxidoreductase YuxK
MTTASSLRYYVFYDGACQLCTGGKATLQQLDPSADLVFVNIQDRAALARFPMVDPRAAQGQMFVLGPDGRLAGGFDAVLALLPTVPSLGALAPLLAWGPLRRLGWAVYRWVARNRYRLGGYTSCAGGACRLPT